MNVLAFSWFPLFVVHSHISARTHGRAIGRNVFTDDGKFLEVEAVEQSVIFCLK